MKPRLVDARGRRTESRREGNRCGYKRAAWRTLLVWKFKVNFLLAIVLWFIRCSHWEKQGKGFMSSVLFLKTECDSTIISKTFLRKWIKDKNINLNREKMLLGREKREERMGWQKQSIQKVEDLISKLKFNTNWVRRNKDYPREVQMAELGALIESRKFGILKSRRSMIKN